MSNEERKRIQLELPRRNAESVMLELERMRMQIAEQIKKVNGLEALCGELLTRMQSVEGRVNLLAAQSRGTGPTVF